MCAFVCYFFWLRVKPTPHGKKNIEKLKEQQVNCKADFKFDSNDAPY